MRLKLYSLAVCGLLTVSVFAKKLSASAADSLREKGVYAILDVAAAASWTDIEKALSINDIALEKGLAARNWLAVFYTYRERGVYFEEQNRPENALPEYEKALHFADSLGKEKEKYLPIIWTDLAIASRKSGDYSACQTWHEKALFLAKKTGNLELEEDSNHGLGFLWETVGEHERAIDFYQKSIEIAEKRRSQTGIVTSTQNIAQTLLKAGHRDLALKKIENAWQLALQQPDTMRRAHVLSDYGEILAAAGAHDQAIEKFEKSLVAYEKLGDQPMIARAHLLLGGAFSAKKDSLAAYFHFEKAIALKEFVRPEDLVQLFLNLGDWHFSHSNLEEAEKNYAECLALASRRRFMEHCQKAHLALSRVADARKMSDLAFFHLKNATAIGDSIAGHEKDLRVAEMEFRFNAEKAKSELQQAKHDQKALIFGSLIALLAVGLGFLFWRNREKARSNRLLKSQSREIEQQNRKLRESNEVLQQFAYATAHDLKEPLRTIGSFIGLIQKRHGGALAPEAVEYMTFVRDGAHRMNNLLTDLLEYSTLCAEQNEIGEVIPLEKALRETLGNLRETIRERDALVFLPEKMPALNMQRTHAVQLFQNLIGNAIKFSPVAPRVEVGWEREPTGHVVFSVKDNGIGIDKSFEKKIFQVFHRLDRQKFEGTGIGLAICKTIAEKYGGSISFDSRVGEGTTFFLRFPAAVAVENVVLSEAVA